MYSLNLVMENTVTAHERLRKRDNVGLSGHSGSAVDGRVQTERFTDDSIEILEGVEIVHRR